MSCINCEVIPPIQDSGTIWLISKLKSVQQKWNGILTDKQRLVEASPANERLPLTYDSKESVMEYFNILSKQLTMEEQAEIQIEFEEKNDSAKPSHPVKLQFSSFIARVKHHHLVQLITDNQFTSYMQPIIDIHKLDIVAYELLMRPAQGRPPFQPYELFQVAQQTGLHSFLDRSARISAIQVSAMHLRKGTKRFINFLPSSIYNPNYCLSHTFQAIEQLDQDPNDFVFEVVETEKITDVKHLKNIFEVYQRHGIQVALDDVGAGFATLEVMTELKPNFVKIDRELVSFCDQDQKKQQIITNIVQCAESFGASVLAEGIERGEELEFCKSEGITLGQGYLIGKPASMPIS